MVYRIQNLGLEFKGLGFRVWAGFPAQDLAQVALGLFVLWLVTAS